MTKYLIILQYYNSENSENLIFFDNNDNKKIIDIKEFITSFNNLICSCMLVVPKKKSFFFFGKDEYYNDDTELKKISNNDIITIIQKSNQCICNFLRENEKLLTLPKKSLIDKLNELKELSDDINIKNEKDFYDIIININSLIKVKNGWKIQIKKNGENRYNLLENSKNKKFCVIGVIGNINCGKSFLISKLTNTNIPSGTNIENDGLCIKYLNKDENTDLNYDFIFLDSKGSNQPILENINKLEDIIATNIFLQNFIILYCNILLLIIDYLSISEQKFINKIKSNIRLLSDKKKLIIIHNLKKYRRIEEVKNYINNILLKSFSFKLKRNEIITSKKENVILGEYYTEYNQKDITVFHLIFAADNSEAGFYYNTFTKYFIEIHYKDIINLRNLDIIENIKKHFCLQSTIYLETNINKEDFLSKDDIIKEKTIKLKDQKQLIFKKYFCQDISMQILEDNYFFPKYTMFKIGKELKIQIELPGNIKVDILRPKFIGNKTHIIIMGKKLRDKEPKDIKDNVIDIRNYGNFNMNINFDKRDYNINPDIKSYEIKDGVLYLIYKIEDENSNEKITLTVDEEI